MKSIIIALKFILFNLCALAQIHPMPDSVPPEPAHQTVKGSILHTQADNIKEWSANVSSKYEIINTSLAGKADVIRYKIEICKNSLDRGTAYPVYLNRLFSNYESVLKLAGTTNNQDSAAIALDFIEKDLSAKTAIRAGVSEEDAFYYDTAPLQVEVKVVDSNGATLQGYEVKARPFFMLDPASIFNFHGLTNQAKEKIIPGWYVFIVKKGSLKKEKDFKIFRTQTQPILLTIPIHD